jgi:zinc resistance-associated protein
MVKIQAQNLKDINKNKIQGGGAKMRRKVLKGLAVVGLIGGLAFTAFADAPQEQNPNPGYQMGPMMMGPGFGGPGKGSRCGYTMQANVDPAKLQKFYEETKVLRQKMWETREALRMSYLSPNPDWKAISEKRAELAKLMTELQAKASQSGVPYVYGMGMGRGFCGMGYGPRI